MNGQKKFSKWAKVIFLGIIAILLLLIAMVWLFDSASAGSGKGIPTGYPSLEGQFDLPTAPWYATGNWNGEYEIFVYPSLAYPTWRVKAYCLEPNDTPPSRGDEYYNDGDKLFSLNPAIQDMKVFEIIFEPQETPTPQVTATPEPTATPQKRPQQYLNYALWTYSKCNCDCHYIDVYKDGILVATVDLTTPNINYSSWRFNLYQGQHLQIVGRYCGYPSNYDYFFDWAQVIINCDGDYKYTYDCPNGVCPDITCPMLNGEENCLVTVSVQACPLCRARFEGTDPLWYIIHYGEGK